MKQLIAIVTTVIIMACASNSFAQRMIQSVSMTFNTTNDDKDWNSFIRFQLQSADGSWMATQEGTFGGSFPNGSTYTFWLALGGNYSEYFLNNSYLYMLFIPVGNDTWNFNWALRINFTDGSYRIRSGTGGLNESGNSFRLQVF